MRRGELLAIAGSAAAEVGDITEEGGPKPGGIIPGCVSDRLREEGNMHEY